MTSATRPPAAATFTSTAGWDRLSGNRGGILSFSVAGVKSVWKWMRSTGAHTWRLTGDIKDKLGFHLRGGAGAVGLEAYAAPCGWNDPDM